MPTENEQLQKEFERLWLEQDEAMKRAVFLGMTPTEASKFDERRKRLVELFRKLYQLKSEI